MTVAHFARQAWVGIQTVVYTALILIVLLFLAGGVIGLCVLGWQAL